MVHMGANVVLVTVVGAKKAREGADFFPLTVEYQEKFYAAGRIPGGFFKREGRPTERETLTCRLIDRPVRPLFPEGFYHEVQIVAMVMSLNPEIRNKIKVNSCNSLASLQRDVQLTAAQVKCSLNPNPKP